jgi:bacillithiol synthase
VCITTGQQPGLLTGPLYTIHKALSAVALARLAAERWGRPVVPVFWLAGDDHDFAEASQVTWLGASNEPVTVTLRQRAPDAPLTPLYREPVGPEIEAVLDRLAADLPPSEFRDQVLELFRRHYRPDATLASSCGGVLAELLGPLGLVLFDPTHPAAKRAQLPLLLGALEHAEEIDRGLVARHAELVRGGQDPGVAVGDGAALVMLEAGLGRDRLVAAGPDFETRRSSQGFRLPDLERLATEAPDRLSPNVLLRPVIESALLPTVGYVAGPGELRYLPLTQPVAAALEVAWRPPLPRWSGIVVDARVDRVLTKFNATLEELLEPGERLEARVVRASLPDEAMVALASLRQANERHYDVLIRSAQAIDPTIEKPLRSLAHQAQITVQDAEKKLLGHLKKRQATETQQIARARELVLPGGRPQERVLTVAPWLARYGPGFLEELESAIEAWYRAGLVAAREPS